MFNAINAYATALFIAVSVCGAEQKSDEGPSSDHSPVIPESCVHSLTYPVPVQVISNPKVHLHAAVRNNILMRMIIMLIKTLVFNTVLLS